MQEVYLFESNDTVTYEILRAEHIPKILKNIWQKEILLQIVSEYKHMIEYVDTFGLYLLTQD